MIATIHPLIVTNDRAAIRAARTREATSRWERIRNHASRSWLRLALWSLEQDERAHYRAIAKIARKRAKLAAAMSSAQGAMPCR